MFFTLTSQQKDKPIQDYKKAIEALKAVDPTQPYDNKFFNALARLTVSVAIEAVCLRLNRSSEALEVFMTQRGPNEAYAGQWHCPGSVLRSEEDIEDVFKRLESKEFGATILSHKFVVNINNPKEERGHFFSVVYLCDIEDSSLTGGEWFPVNQLPKNTAWHHAQIMIPAVAKEFSSKA